MLHIGVSASLFTPPSPGLNQADNFSVRFYGSIVPTTTASYRLWTNSDDGVILWWHSGGTWQKLIDNPNTYVGQAYTNYFTLTAGQRYPIVLDYFEIGGNANIQLQWQLSTSSSVVTIPQANLSTSIAVDLPDDGACPAGAAPAGGISPLAPVCQLGTGLRAEYFNNVSLNGTSVATRIESVNLSDSGTAGTNSIPAGISSNLNNFSVRWEGLINFPLTGLWTLSVETDDGVCVWLENTQTVPSQLQQVVNQWVVRSTVANQFTVQIAAGQTTRQIRIEYFDLQGGATAQLKWLGPGQSPPQATPTLIDPNYLYPATSGSSTPTCVVPYTPSIISDGSRQWDSTETQAINAGVDRIGRAFDFLSNAVTNSPITAFGRVMAEASGTEILFIRANQPSQTVTINSYQYRFGSQKGQTASFSYPGVPIGGCTTFQEGVVNNVLRPSAVICNGLMQDQWTNNTFTGRVTEYTVIHELGHIFDYRSFNPVSGDTLTSTIATGYVLDDCNGLTILGSGSNSWVRADRGWGTGPAQYLGSSGQGVRYLSNFQQNSSTIPLEATADSFLNWVYRLVATSGAVAGNSCIPTSWAGPGFLNQIWTAPLSAFPANNNGIAGSPDNTGLSGDRRHYDIDRLIRQLFVSKQW